MNKIKSNFDGQTIFVGMDIHKSSWNLGIHLDDMYVKNVHQQPNPHILASYLKQHSGAHYKAVYEAGKFGFWIQRQLTALGIECLVVKKRSIFFCQDCSACFSPLRADNYRQRLSAKNQSIKTENCSMCAATAS